MRKHSVLGHLLAVLHWPLNSITSKAHQGRITPRSSGAPTASHQARSGGERYIFASPGLASCRWRQLSWNVSRQNSEPDFPLPVSD
jgi:hypothetical protein